MATGRLGQWPHMHIWRLHGGSPVTARRQEGSRAKVNSWEGPPNHLMFGQLQTATLQTPPCPPAPVWLLEIGRQQPGHSTRPVDMGGGPGGDITSIWWSRPLWVITGKQYWCCTKSIPALIAAQQLRDLHINRLWFMLRGIGGRQSTGLSALLIR